MSKTIFPLMVIAALIAACGKAVIPTSTTAVVPSATPVTRSSPILITEIKLQTQTGTSYSLAWSPDGKTLAAASGAEITLLGDNLKEIRAVLRPEGGALDVTWSPDQKQFATVNGFRNPTVTVWDWNDANAQLTRNQQIQAGIDQYGVAWSPEGKLLATLAGDRKSVFQIWDTTRWNEIRKFDLPYTNPRRTLNWSTDSSTLYGAGELTGQLAIFALNTIDGTVKGLGKFPTARAEVFAVSPNADRFGIADAGVSLAFSMRPQATCCRNLYL